MEEQPSTSRGIKRSIPEQLRGEIDVIAAKVSRLTGICSSNHRFIDTGIQ